MAVTSGFFNSSNGDRKYDAREISALFDGLINDGIFSNIGSAFVVSAAGGNVITVGPGRAWFNSIWLKNDAILSITAPAPHLLLPRYDAVIIEIDNTQAVRAGSIKIIQGTAASTPVVPTMANQADFHQYPLAIIYRGADAESISQGFITSKIGTAECPYATGVLNVNARLTALEITGGVVPNDLQVVNVILYSGAQPALTGVPNGTLFIKYVP